ncbi:hypothetical protein GTP46_05770 [Duganella sp. FT135W]|uniref:ORC1/DEAH AAA+ ATPase domain-containing protein n=1 Tax=Duganella flavida TaxID=2692175 RepID=A0A6L8K4J0_9BURK|nr:ATP-binding protein [Duganella flavida]MYM22150.1 hypothetical protein [Duganella flavida]
MNDFSENSESDKKYRFPIAKRDYMVVTPMMLELFEIVSNDVNNMETGICVWSTSRFGKTTAKEYVINELKRKNKSLTTIDISMGTIARDSAANFFMYFERAGLISLDDEQSTGDYVSDISRRLLVITSQRQEPRVLITIDEAHKMTGKRYFFLMDLTNELERLGMAPIVFSIGQPEILELRSNFVSKKKKEIVGRFLEDPIALLGVSCEDSFRQVLECYDNHNKMEFPRGSGICITAVFAFNQYRSGLRLENFAKAAWQAITSAANSLQLNPMVGMKSLVKIIQCALTNIAANSSIDDVNTEEWWAEILDQSGYLKQLARNAGDGSDVET